MKRDAQGALLILVGVAVLRLSLTDTYLRYVKQGLQPFLIAAGVVVLALGLLALLTPADTTPADAHDEGHTQTDGHDHEGGPRVAWLLVLPVATIFLIAPPALGAFAASRDAAEVAQPQDELELDTLPRDGVVDLLVSDYAVRAVWDETKSLQGRTLSLVGFVTFDKKGSWYLTRMALSCCAADATAVKVQVRSDIQAPTEGTWIKLVGTWIPSDPDAGVPIIAATEVTPIEEPRETYE